MAKKNKNELLPEQRSALLNTLKTRFEKNMNRHKGIEWAKVQSKLEANAEKLWSLNEMEITGGEPDVVSHEKKQANTVFMIVQKKAQKAAEAFATTVRHWKTVKNLSREITPLIWPLPWVLNC